MKMTRDQAMAVLAKTTKAKGTKGSRVGSMFLANHKGDETICMFEPGVESSVKIADDKLDEFMDACIAKYGTKPPAWKRMPGETEFDIFDPSNDSIGVAEEIMLQFPMTGG